VLGLADGLDDGEVEGLVEGEVEGLVLGDVEGLEDGEVDGLEEGEEDGELLGDDDATGFIDMTIFVAATAVPVVCVVDWLPVERVPFESDTAQPLSMVLIRIDPTSVE
jgi:hypothetical protein